MSPNLFITKVLLRLFFLLLLMFPYKPRIDKPHETYKQFILMHKKNNKLKQQDRVCSADFIKRGEIKYKLFPTNKKNYYKDFIVITIALKH